jgi:TPR repeat protein
MPAPWLSFLLPPRKARRALEELPPLELRILAPPAPGRRALRYWFGGILAVFVLSMFAGPFLQVNPAPSGPWDLPSRIHRAEDLPPALRGDYERALTGDAAAMRALGRRYYYGEDVPRNVAEAVYWYRSSAALGDMQAAEELEHLEVPH